MVTAMISDPKTFNPLMANETSSTDITDRIFSGLIDFDYDTQQFVPGIAKSWEVAPDGVTWTFHLRQGAKFSDGHPITAEDVLFTAQVIYDEALHPSIQDLMKMNGKPFGIRRPILISSRPLRRAIVLIPVGGVSILPKHVLEPAYKSGNFASAYSVSTPLDQVVTSGAWMTVLPGEKTVLGRNPY
jgi:peptide/nickel transport system substrate-binding protein